MTIHLHLSEGCYFLCFHLILPVAATAWITINLLLGTKTLTHPFVYLARCAWVLSAFILFV